MNETRSLTRRDFLKVTFFTAAASLATKRLAWTAEARSEIPHRALGRTGEKVSLVGIGGFHLGRPDEQEAIGIVRTAVDSGVNFMDNCWDYNRGVSEVRMGKALRDGYRNRVFLMTKIDSRERKLAQRQIEESLRRLQTDHLDLLQLHEVIRGSDPDRAFAKGGSMEALIEAKQSGKTRYLGFTGHKDPSIHLKMLDSAAAHDFRFDTVQMPLNVMDAHFDSFQQRVLPRLVKEQIGVLGMKPMGSGLILESNKVTPVECLHYAMSLPTSVVITGCDSMKVLQQALDAAKSFRPLSQSEVTALLDKTREVAKLGQFEPYKISPRFDATVYHPEWLG